MYLNCFWQGCGRTLPTEPYLKHNRHHDVFRWAITIFKSSHSSKGQYKEGYSMAGVVSLASLSLVKEKLSILGYIVLEHNIVI